MEVLKQPQYAPYPLEQQVAILYLSINGYLLDVEVGKIASFVKSYLEYLQNYHADLMRSIGETGEVSAEQEGEFRSAAEQFKKPDRN
jgi:F0F1-type ATP synthase alpha subunit